MLCTRPLLSSENPKRVLSQREPLYGAPTITPARPPLADCAHVVRKSLTGEGGLA